MSVLFEQVISIQWPSSSLSSLSFSIPRLSISSQAHSLYLWAGKRIQKDTHISYVSACFILLCEQIYLHDTQEAKFESGLFKAEGWNGCYWGRQSSAVALPPPILCQTPCSAWMNSVHCRQTPVRPKHTYVCQGSAVPALGKTNLEERLTQVRRTAQTHLAVDLGVQVLWNVL